MAGPLRFRRSTGTWNEQRVRGRLFGPLDANLGATMTDPSVEPPEGYEARRFDMDNGDFALFCWARDGGRAYWLGNTETPEALWRTEKYGFEEVPYPIARWAQRVLLADLAEEDPWLASYRHVAWFFLPVFLSKDGRDSTREFFADHSAGFPDADPDEAIDYLERFLSRGVLDEYREVMAGKLGTSSAVDRTRMSATMAEFIAARLLDDAGYPFVPEVPLESGYALDFRVRDPPVPDGWYEAEGLYPGDTLVEVTRPRPVSRRSADSPIAAVRQTAGSKTDGQLDAHPDALLFVDCSSFRDDEWLALKGERPAVSHEPAVVYRARPNGSLEGYPVGAVPLDLGGGIRWV